MSTISNLQSKDGASSSAPPSSRKKLRIRLVGTPKRGSHVVPGGAPVGIDEVNRELADVSFYAELRSAFGKATDSNVKDPADGSGSIAQVILHSKEKAN